MTYKNKHLDVCFNSASQRLHLTKSRSNPSNITARQTRGDGISTTANYVLILSLQYVLPATSSSSPLRNIALVNSESPHSEIYFISQLLPSVENTAP